MASLKHLPYPPRAPLTEPGSGLATIAGQTFFNQIVEMLTTLTQLGTRANQPSATTVFPGTLYYVTDENKIERSNGNTWDLFQS